MPHDMRVVTEGELRARVSLDLDVVAIVERALAALAKRNPSRR